MNCLQGNTYLCCSHVFCAVGIEVGLPLSRYLLQYWNGESCKSASQQANNFAPLHKHLHRMGAYITRAKCIEQVLNLQRNFWT